MDISGQCSGNVTNAFHPFLKGCHLEEKKIGYIKQKVGLVVTIFAAFHTTEGDVLDLDCGFMFCGLVEPKQYVQPF